VAGELGLATAPMLGMRLLTVMDAHHSAVLDVELAEVTFLGCSGIGMLVAVRNTAERTGCQMRISHPQPMVALILDVVGLLGLFTAPIVLAEPPPGRSASLMRRVWCLPWSAESPAEPCRQAAVWSGFTRPRRGSCQPSPRSSGRRRRQVWF
jgi:anti-anti-sigma factor